MSFEFDERLLQEQDQMVAEAGFAARAKSRLSFDPERYREHRRRRTRRTRFALGAAAAAVVVAALYFGVPSRTAAPLAAVSDGVPVSVGEWVYGSADSARSLRFSDGSAIVLSDAAGVRLQSTDAAGARVSLEHGSVEARIVHREESRWTLQAGPYAVAVTGTRFTVDWHPDTRLFQLSLHEGSVAVTGPGISGRKTVRAGETLAVGGKPKPMDSPALAVIKAEPETPDTAAEPLPEAVSPAPAHTDDDAKTTTPVNRDAPWKAAAASGRFGEATAAARRAGLPRILSRASSSELMLLGDAARRAGEAALAGRIYKTVCRRFPDTRAASDAAFSLGVTAFDRQGDYGEAARWFRAALNSGTAGAFSREASGRLMEALGRAGDREGAREAATRYLRQYPDGPHAPVARALLKSN